MIEPLAKSIYDKTKEYIIFDIGARDCLQSIEFYKQFPNARIYAFECNPNTLEICRKNIAEYADRIKLIEGAVCDYDGTITFYPINQEKTQTSWADGNPGASSIFKSNGTYTVENYVQDEIQTNCHRLDTIMCRENIPRVDIIWMDLQGAELLALKGLGEYINSVQYIFTEVSYKPIYENQVMFNELNAFITQNGLIAKSQPTMRGWQEDVLYERPIHFDIVIPVGPNDIDIIKQQIPYTFKNIIGRRRVFLITCVDDLTIPGCITISESRFEFNKSLICQIFGKETPRAGWYLQQLIKLYASRVIPDLSDKYLVIDADTFFMKPTQFIIDDCCAYNFGLEYHTPYFEHMHRMNSGFVRHANKSGICHHMMFETKYLGEIFNIIETEHGKPFWKVFLEQVQDIDGSGASEYELYFNYMVGNHPDKIIIRELKWKNVMVPDFNLYKLFDYVSYHYYDRSI